jgi:hypothetical protein
MNRSGARSSGLCFTGHTGCVACVVSVITDFR